MRNDLEITRGRPTQMVAAIFALSAFAVAIVAGLGAGADATRTVVVALVAMMLCHVVGTVIGTIAESTAAEAIQAHRDAKPVPALLTEEDIAQEQAASPESAAATDTIDKINATEPEIARAA